ncbi:MAG TPA: TrkA family potassium uptake protein [Lachnospiraceae bacterium]|nr:TrkA family potassium uptake protein [Lachnospiraceae bacterium]
MRSFLVIGLGAFGQCLAENLTSMGNEVMVIDRNEDRVNRMAPLVTGSQIGDCQDIEILKSVGVDNYDICFVCICDDFQGSLEITSNLRELNAKYIVSRAELASQTKFLKAIGADEVINPEKDMAKRTAVRFSMKGAFEYIELTPEYGIFEAAPPASWIGKTVSDVNVRTNYSINIIGIKNGRDIRPMTRADHVFTSSEHLIIAGSNKDTKKLLDER